MTEERKVESKSLHKKGQEHQQKGEHDQALEYYNKSLKIDEERGDKGGISDNLHQLGTVYQGKGEYEQAISYYNRSLTIDEELGHAVDVAGTKGQIGLLNMELKRYTEALICFTQAYILYKQEGAPETKQAARDILRVKTFINETDFTESLERVGIAVEELAKYEDDLFQAITLLAVEGGEEATEAIREVIKSLPEQALGEEENEIIAYLEYLEKLSQAKDQNEFIKNSDPNMLILMQMILKDQPDKEAGNIPGAGDAEKNPLEVLTLYAYQGHKEAIEVIQATIESLPVEVNESEEGEEVREYLHFLLKLASTENREEFLKKADREMVTFMLNLIPEDIK